MTYPRCFDSQQHYQWWLEALEECRIKEGHPKPTYCSDCLPEFKKRMISEGRCEHPTVKFFKNGPKSYYGRRIYYLGKEESTDGE